MFLSCLMKQLFEYDGRKFLVTILFLFLFFFFLLNKSLISRGVVVKSDKKIYEKLSLLSQIEQVQIFLSLFCFCFVFFFNVFGNLDLSGVDSWKFLVTILFLFSFLYLSINLLSLTRNYKQARSKSHIEQSNISSLYIYYRGI